MDFTFTIQSLNKIALGAFVAVLGLIIFETWMMLKNDKKKNVVTSLPDFKNGFTQKVVIPPLPVKEVKVPEVKKASSGKKMYIALLLIILLGLILFTGYYFYTQSNLPTQKVANTTTTDTIESGEEPVKTVESSGIILFDASWKRILSENIESKLGDKIYIGIETVAGSDIDKARIRVNSSVWTTEHETKAVNGENGVFYKEYVVATAEPSLKIDAQLHSMSGGWLEE